jgi:hypothetical protein
VFAMAREVVEGAELVNGASPSSRISTDRCTSNFLSSLERFFVRHAQI